MYTLPRPSSLLVTQWFNHSIKQGTFKGYTVKWVGTPMIDSVDSPCQEHVFILQRRHSFVYTTLFNNQFTKLPSHLHLALFTSAIPYATHNRTHVDVAGTQVNLPIVPDELYRTTKKKKIIFPTWHNASARQPTSGPLESLGPLGPILTHALENAVHPVPNPFAGRTTQELRQELQHNSALQHSMDAVTAFVYHYCRDTLGFTSAASSIKMSV